MKIIQIHFFFFLFLNLWANAGVLAGSSFPMDSIPKEWLKSGYKQYDDSLRFQIKEALNDIVRKEIFLIDVRSKEEYEKFHIPDSLNLPLFAVKTKIFLKAKPIVLLNGGYAYESLEAECRRLNENGFNAKILAGGLNAWKQMGGKLETMIAAADEIDQIPAKDFFTEKNYANWNLIHVAAAVDPDALLLVPSAIRIPFKNEKQFISALEKALGGHSTSSMPWLIVFNENGKGYTSIARMIQKSRTCNLFFLKDGMAGYKQFLKQRIQAGVSGPPAKTTAAKCPACPE